MKFSIKSCFAISLFLVLVGTTIVSAEIISSGHNLHNETHNSVYNSTLFRDKQISPNYGKKYEVFTEAANRYTGTCVQNYATGLYTQQKCTTVAGRSINTTNTMDGNYFSSHSHKSWSN